MFSKNQIDQVEQVAPMKATHRWKRHLGVSLLSIALLLLQRAAWAENLVDTVTFGTGGETLGTYRKVSPGKWVELNPAGETQFQFDEVNRTDSMIGLEDKSRNISLTIDFEGKNITYGEIGGAHEPLYDIIDLASGTASVDQSAGEQQTVYVGSDGAFSGSYVNVQTGVWEERDKDGKAQFTFAEKEKTPERILLEDAARGVALTIDLANNVVMYGAIGDAIQEPLYAIMQAPETPAAEAAASTPPADTDPALAVPPDPLPYQIRLKNNGWFPGRFTVKWTVDGSSEEASWTSEQQDAPYFYALPFPDNATNIHVLGEAKIADTWKPILDITIDDPNNACHVLMGTAETATSTVSEEPSYELGDDCS